MSNEPLWSVGQRVHVFFEPGTEGHFIKDGTIDRVQDAGPYEEQPYRRIRVTLDDQTLAGGTGHVWVAEDQLTTA